MSGPSRIGWAPPQGGYFLGRQYHSCGITDRFFCNLVGTQCCTYAPTRPRFAFTKTSTIAFLYLMPIVTALTLFFALRIRQAKSVTMVN